MKGQEASVSTALGERERSLQARQDQLATELQERERRLRSHEDECLATDRQLTASKAALDRARYQSVSQSVSQSIIQSFIFLGTYRGINACRS